MIYGQRPISRRKALEAATQVYFHHLANHGRDLQVSYESLRLHLATQGFNHVTSAEMSDIWRHSSFFFDYNPNLPQGDEFHCQLCGKVDKLKLILDDDGKNKWACGLCR